jgi:hypothetical protein
LIYLKKLEPLNLNCLAILLLIVLKNPQFFSTIQFSKTRFSCCAACCAVSFSVAAEEAIY